MGNSKLLFDTNCGSCHGEQSTTSRSDIWVTPIKAVGTDPKMVINSSRMSDPGRFAGTPLPPPAFGVFGAPAKTHDVLAAAVLGGMMANSPNPFGGAASEPALSIKPEADK
jgi:hypothetical protein